MANPFDQFDQPSGPVYGPGPKLDPYKDRDQQLQEEAAIRQAEDQRLQQEKARREALEWAATHNPDGSPKPNAVKDPKTTQDERAAAGYYRRALNAHNLYGEGIAPRNPLAQTAVDLLPDNFENMVDGPARRAANNYADEFIRAKLRKESGASIPTEEMDREYKVYFPVPGDKEADLQRKARLRQEAIEALRIASGSEADAALQGLSAPGNPSAPSDQLTPSTNGYKTVDNPELAGVRGEYLKRLAAGAGPGELVRFLREAGITDPKLLQTAAQQAQFRRNNPNVPIEQYNIGALDDMDVPISGWEQSMTDASQTALGAAGMNAANAVSMNNLDSIVGMTGGNAERARLALDQSSEQHPVASLAGGLTGGVTAALGGEALLGAGGMSAGLGRSLLADTAYGAGAGAGATDNGDRGMGALYGAGAGAAGSLGGQAVARGLSSMISPTGGKLADLYASGVRPTPGQRALAAGGGEGVRGVLGRAANGAEEALSSVPLIGSAISGARQEARNQFQIGAFNEALKEIGDKLPKGIKVGTAPHIYAEKAFDRVYDKARSGLVIRPDTELANDVATLSSQLDTLAEPSRKRFDQIVQNVVLRRANGPEIGGGAYKNIQSDIGRTIRGIRKSQSGDGELADALEDLQGILDSAARRHSRPEAVKLLDDADRGYAKFVRIQEAAKARGGDAGTFTPTQFDRSIQRNARGNRSQEYLRGEALMQDYADQGMSLVDRIPNSGSADRAFMGLTAAGGAGLVEPSSLTMMGILGALYAPGVRKGIQAVTAPRGPKAKAISDAVRQRARIAGASGAVLGTSPDQ